MGTKQDSNIASDKELPLMESFYSIQGEGFHQGKAAYFIRLAGCDVGCIWCDVKASWDVSKYELVSIHHMVQAAKKHPSDIIVITGGEPLMYDLTTLTGKLQKEGLQTHLETSGAYSLTGSWDWICLSPKKFSSPLESNIFLANELKIIVYNPSDFKWAEKYAEQVSKNCKLYLQPEWSMAQKMLPKIIDYVKEHPKWDISLQIHKYMNIE